MEKFKQIWKSQSEDQRRKIIAYSIVGVLGVGMFSAVYLIKSEDTIQKVDELSNPDAKAGKNYNSRLEANQMDRKDSSNINMAIDEIFGTSKPEPVTEEQVEINSETYYEPNYSSTQSNYSGSASGGGASTRRSYQFENEKNNDSEFYEETQNTLSISKAEKRGSTKRYSKKEVVGLKELAENIDREKDISNIQQEKKTMQIKARLLSQGFITTGKSISFVLLEKAKINDVTTKKGQIVTGVAQEQNNRLMVKFTTIKADGKIIPVEMQLYGSDGMEGLPISGVQQQSSGRTSSIINSTIGSVPVIGGIANDALQNNSSNRKSNIKLTPNISCIILYKI